MVMTVILLVIYVAILFSLFRYMKRNHSNNEPITTMRPSISSLRLHQESSVL